MILASNGSLFGRAHRTAVGILLIKRSKATLGVAAGDVNQIVSKHDVVTGAAPARPATSIQIPQARNARFTQLRGNLWPSQINRLANWLHLTLKHTGAASAGST